MSINRTLIILLLLVAPGWCHARLTDKPLIDSLLKELSRSKKDTNRVNILTDLSFAYSAINTDEGIKYGNEGLELAQKLQWDPGIIVANIHMGVNYKTSRDYTKALDCLQKALKLAQANRIRKYEARGSRIIGDIYLDMAEYEASREHYQQALHIYEELQLVDDIAGVEQNIGADYLGQSNYPAALDHDLKALHAYIGVHDKAGTAGSMSNIGAVYQLTSRYDTALDYDLRALKLYEELGATDSLRILANIAAAYAGKENYTKALEYHKRVYSAYERSADKSGIARTLDNIAGMFNAEANYPDALEYYFKALKIYEETGTREGIANEETNIGWLYFFQNHFSQALEYDFKALDIYKEFNDTLGVANCFSAIGSAYSGQKNFSEAINYLNKSIGIYEAIGIKTGMANDLTNLGDIYFKFKNYPMALACDFRALKMDKELMDNDNGVAINLGNIGESYLGIAKDTTGNIKADSLISKDKSVNLRKAIEYLNAGLVACEKSGNVNAVMENNQYLSEAYALNGDYKDAYKCHVIYTALKDSIYSTDNSLKTSSLERNRDMELKNKQIHIDELELQKKRNERGLFIGGVIILLIIIGIMMRNHRTQKKTNNLLAIEKGKSEKLLADIRVKNKAITDNIEYAQRIQSAILPDIQLIYKALAQSFILYLPKDVVSGDFYAFAEKNNKVLIMGGDCTGHGVSGAFMSMIGSSLLTRIINEKEVEEPSDILNQLNGSVIDTFRHSDNESNDGMDIAVCSIDLINNELRYAGANRPLWLVRNGELIVVKPDKFPIGGLKVAKSRAFTNHIIKLQKNDTFYIFTDGYADQFGGEHGKKMMTTKFKQLLVSIQNKTMPEQEHFLKEYFKNWEGFHEQVDDVLVIGVRV